MWLFELFSSSFLKLNKWCIWHCNLVCYEIPFQYLFQCNLLNFWNSMRTFVCNVILIVIMLVSYVQFWVILTFILPSIYIWFYHRFHSMLYCCIFLLLLFLRHVAEHEKWVNVQSYWTKSFYSNFLGYQKSNVNVLSWVLTVQIL